MYRYPILIWVRAFSLEEAVGAELRVLDGGADTDSVYNFARFNSAAIVVSTGF